MTNRTATVTVTMNSDESIAVDATNRGMPLDKIAHGMAIALEGQILDKIAHSAGQEITPELRQTLAQPIRDQALMIFNEAPKIDERDGVAVHIPNTMEVPDVEG